MPWLEFTNDLENKADYRGSGYGVGFTYDSTYKEAKKRYEAGNLLTADERSTLNSLHNKIGFIPNLPSGAKGSDSSITQSAISKGHITVYSDNVDMNELNRNTADTLHTLTAIFDKKKVEERQELASLFAKNAFEQIHYWEPKTDQEKTEKAIVHGIIAEISARLAGTTAGSGFYAGFTNEMVINKLADISHNDPAKMQWLSAAVGAGVNALIGNDVQTGARVAQSGTKDNELQQYSGWDDRAKDRIGNYNELQQLIWDNKQKAANEVVYAVKVLLKEHPEVITSMSSDYIATSISTPIVETLACVAIVDKFGNVYGSLALAPGVTAGLPGSISKGYLPATVDSTTDKFMDAIEGAYGSVTARGVVGGSIGLSQIGVISELNAGANVELSVEFGYTWYIGNINNNWQ